MSPWGNKCDWRRLIKNTQKTAGLQADGHELGHKKRPCTINSQARGFEPLNRRKTCLQLYKYSFKGKTRTGRDAWAQEEDGAGFIESLVPIKWYLSSFSPHLCDLMCPQSSVHKKLYPFNNTLPPSFPPSLPFFFFMPFSFLPQYPPFSSPSFCSAVAMTTAALHHSSVGDLGSCSCRERAPLTSIHNTLSANAVTEANEELGTICAHRLLAGRSSLHCLFFLFLFFSRPLS